MSNDPGVSAAPTNNPPCVVWWVPPITTTSIEAVMWMTCRVCGQAMGTVHVH